MHFISDETLRYKDIYNEDNSLQKTYEVEGLATHRDYRGRGIAKNLMKESFKVHN